MFSLPNVVATKTCQTEPCSSVSWKLGRRSATTTSVNKSTARPLVLGSTHKFVEEPFFRASSDFRPNDVAKFGCFIERPAKYIFLNWILLSLGQISVNEMCSCRLLLLIATPVRARLFSFVGILVGIVRK